MLLHYNINIVVLKNKMEKEKTPVERLHDDIRQALEKIEVKVPLVIRLAGTNVEKGNKILKDSNINYIEASTLEEAANKAVAALK